jgi:hypothetical protein
MLDGALREGLAKIARIATQLSEICVVTDSSDSEVASDAGRLADDKMDGLFFNLTRQSQSILPQVATPSLPDPRLVRRIIKRRQFRGRFIDPEILGEPAWDIAEHRRVSVTSLCIASGVPSTTALRWIDLLVRANFCDWVEDEKGGRKTFVSLSDFGVQQMARYFAEAW